MTNRCWNCNVTLDDEMTKAGGGEGVCFNGVCQRAVALNKIEVKDIHNQPNWRTPYVLGCNSCEYTTTSTAKHHSKYCCGTRMKTLKEKEYEPEKPCLSKGYSYLDVLDWIIHKQRSW